jgi:hypothetical protein
LPTDFRGRRRRRRERSILRDQKSLDERAIRYDAGSGAASRLSILGGEHEGSLVDRWPIDGRARDNRYISPKNRDQVARQGVRHAPGSVAPRSSVESARMYEARPGVWISTYDCITDDGYGRWRKCSDGGGRGGM